MIEYVRQGTGDIMLIRCYMNKEKFEGYMKNAKCNEILEIKKGNVGLPFEIFFKTFNKILDKHLSLRKLSIQEKKTILVSLQIKIVNIGVLKNQRCSKKGFKTYCNKLRKSMHYQQFFEASKTILCTIWDLVIRKVINIE